MTKQTLLLFFLLSTLSVGASEQTTISPSTRELLKARLAEEAKKGPSAAASPASPSTIPPAPTASGQPEQNPLLATGTAPAAAAPRTETEKEKAARLRAEPATVLPKVEVRRNRVTELDRQLAKQEQDIAREKKNTKPTETDQALNNSKVSRALSIFGGESAEFRKRVATERVSLMEDEKDLIEAMARAKTKEEKELLQKQLDVIRAQRRELDRTAR